MPIRSRLAFVAAAAVLLPLAAVRLHAGGTDDASISAADLMKVYATEPKDFDQKYKGKTVTVEGVVEYRTNPDFMTKERYLMLAGFQKPGNPVSSSVRCQGLSADVLPYLRKGDKVTVRGVVQPHKETSFAAELRDCKLVKCDAQDYPPTQAVKDVVKKLDGNWTVVKVEAKGKEGPAKAAGIDKLHFDGLQIDVFLPKNQILTWGLALDPTRTPTHVDLIVAPGKRIPILAELKGDQLRLALPPPNGARPASFDTADNPNQVLYAEREKK